MSLNQQALNQNQGFKNHKPEGGDHGCFIFIIMLLIVQLIMHFV